MLTREQVLDATNTTTLYGHWKASHWGKSTTIPETWYGGADNGYAGLGMYSKCCGSSRKIVNYCNKYDCQGGKRAECPKRKWSGNPSWHQVAGGCACALDSDKACKAWNPTTGWPYSSTLWKCSTCAPLDPGVYSSCGYSALQCATAQKRVEQCDLLDIAKASIDKNPGLTSRHRERMYAGLNYKICESDNCPPGMKRDVKVVAGGRGYSALTWFCAADKKKPAAPCNCNGPPQFKPPCCL